MRLQASLVVLQLLSLAASAAAQSPAAASSAALKAIPKKMQEFVDAKQIAGAVTLVARDGQVVSLEAVGHADLQTGRPMEPDTMFSIASMTKPIVATAVMILQDDGKLDVDHEVSRYLPHFAQLKLTNGEVPQREVTIRDVLTHTAGLSGSQVFEGTLAEAVDGLSSQPLGFEPGTKWQYSPGLNVAGRIVEVVAGQPIEQFLAERIFQPLGMKDTTFFPDEKQRQRIATMYQPGGADGGELVPAENFITNPHSVKSPNPSGGLYSTAPDLFRFYQMVLDKGQWQGERILSEDAVSEMTRCHTGELPTGFTPGNCWGLGWCVVREPQGVTAMLSPGTFGHGGAFGTQGWVDPKTESIYVLLIQRVKLRNSDASDMRREFQTLATEGL